MAATIEQAVTAAQTEPSALPGPAQVTAETLPAVTDAPAPKPAPITAAAVETTTPKPRPIQVALASPEPEPELKRVVVARLSTSGGRHWGINVGRFTTRYQAERVLLKTALVELGTLDTALRKVASSSSGHDANFVGMTRESAAARLSSAFGPQY